MQKSLYRVHFGDRVEEFEAFTFYHLAALVDLRKAHRVQVQTPNRIWVNCCKSALGKPNLRESVRRLTQERIEEPLRFAERASGCPIALTGTYAGLKP
jgi:hypothetical protein